MKNIIAIFKCRNCGIVVEEAKPYERETEKDFIIRELFKTPISVHWCTKPGDLAGVTELTAIKYKLF